jgi:hypothetical protein
MNERLCSQCELPVDPTDDAVLLVSQAQQLRGIPLTEDPQKRPGKHLRPNANCRGTPSLAQYFPSQPRDPRPAYAYNDNSAILFQRAMWQIIQGQDVTIPP